MKRPSAGRRAWRIVAEAMADRQESMERKRGDFRRFAVEYLAPHRKQVWLIFGSLAATAVIPFFFALTHQLLIDRVLAPGGPPTDAGADFWRLHVPFGLAFVVVANLVLHAANMGTFGAASLLSLRVSQDVALRLREDLYRKLDALHLGFFDRTQSGRIVARLQSDTACLQNAIRDHITHLLVAPLRLTIGLGFLFWMNAPMAWIVTASLPFYALAFILLRSRIRRMDTARSRLNSRLYGLASERLGAIRTVAAFARERRELGLFSRGVHDMVRLGQRQALYGHGVSFLAVTISTTAVGAVLCYGLAAVRDGVEGVTLGSVMAFLQVTQQVFQPIQTLTAMAAVIQATAVSLRRVFALLDEPAHAASGRIRLTGISGSVRFDGVSFRYPTQETDALRDVRLNVAPGEHVAVMGPSGAGKSTLFNLILRFYDPREGVVLIGGVDVREADTASLRRHVRYVQQEPFVFSGTIAENIAYGQPKATREDIIEAARFAELHDFVISLPDQYDTRIGENGIGLSGGQRQRLALATALLTRPEVLLLDDATSALDAETEARIRQTLGRVLEKRTSLIITQRVSMARTCDRIVVLDAGAIVQTGSHAELAAADGFYRRICEQQNVF